MFFMLFMGFMTFMNFMEIIWWNNAFWFFIFIFFQFFYQHILRYFAYHNFVFYSSAILLLCCYSIRNDIACDAVNYIGLLQLFLVRAILLSSAKCNFGFIFYFISFYLLARIFPSVVCIHSVNSVNSFYYFSLLQNILSFVEYF